MRRRPGPQHQEAERPLDVAKLRRMEDFLQRAEEQRKAEAEKARHWAEAEAEEQRNAEAARMEAKVQEFLTFHGLQLCQGHGICYESRTGYCHLVSSAAFEQDIGDRVIGYIRHRCKRKKIQCRWPCKIKELGQHVSRLLDGRASSDATESWCFVGTRKKLLYFCGCKNIQPMLKGSFERHIHAEGNQNKCRWSLWGKPDEEKLVMEATAVACCRVRCVKATCGLWIIRDRIEPDMSKLSKIVQKLIARRVDRGNQQSDLGDESTLAVSNEPSPTSAKADEEENSSDPQPEMEVEESAADAEAPAESESTSTATTSTSIAKSTKPVILLLGYTFRQETNETSPTYGELLEEAKSFYGKDNTQLPGAIRDKARIIGLLDRGFDCFCVSKSNKDENDESMHYYGDFCDSRIRSKYVWIVSAIPHILVRFHVCTSCPAKIAHISYISMHLFSSPGYTAQLGGTLHTISSLNSSPKLFWILRPY